MKQYVIIAKDGDDTDAQERRKTIRPYIWPVQKY